MSSYAPASPAAYQQQAILTAPPERLLLMLYDGACRFLLQAAAGYREGDQRGAERLRRAEAIIDELMCTLDMDAGEIAHRLHGLYVFFKRQLSEARAERSPEKIEWVHAQLSELRDAWAQAAGG